MPPQKDSVVYIYYVKAWDSQEDYRDQKPPVKHYLFNEMEGIGFEIKMNIRVGIHKTVAELKEFLLRHHAKIDYGLAQTAEWLDAQRKHNEKYGSQLRAQGKVNPRRIVVRSR